MNAYYILDRSSNGQWFWVLKAPNHETICVSETYVSRQGALTGISSNQRYSGTLSLQDKTATNTILSALAFLGTTGGYYVLDRARNGQWFWVLKAPNHETIGVSETYVSHQGALEGISANRRHGRTQHLLDRTTGRAA